MLMEDTAAWKGREKNQRKDLCVDVILYHVQDVGELSGVDLPISVLVEGVHVVLGLGLSPAPLIGQLGGTDEPIAVVIVLGHYYSGRAIGDPVGR